MSEIVIQNEDKLNNIPDGTGPVADDLTDESRQEMSSFLPVNINCIKQSDLIYEHVNRAIEVNFLSNDPLNEFQTEFIASMAFPILFPDEKGDPTNYSIVRDIASSDTDAFALKIKHLLKFAEFVNNTYQYRFAAHPRFAYWAYNILYRKIILSKGNLYIKQNPGDSDFTLAEFNEMISSPNNPLMSKIFYYTKEVTGSNSYWNRVRQELNATLKQVGAPTIFFTLSMAGYHWPDLLRLLGLQRDASSQDVRSAISNNPHLVDWFFTERTEAFVKSWLYDCLGATWHWFRYEFTVLRGPIHCHGLAKLKNDPGLLKLTKLAKTGFLANEYRNKIDQS